MAGIKANSLSVTMVDGDTAVDKAIGGFAINEQVTLSTAPAGTTYLWTLGRPADSTSTTLSSTTAASPTFSPDVAGVYMLTCLVDATTSYQLRATVAALSVVNSVQVTRYYAQPDSAIPTPLTDALTLYKSDTVEGLSYKLDTGTVYTLQGTSSIYNAGTASTSLAIDWSNGNYQYALVTGDAALTFTWPAVGLYRLLLEQDGTGSHTPTVPATVTSDGGTIRVDGAAGGLTLLDMFWTGTVAVVTSSANLASSTVTLV